MKDRNNKKDEVWVVLKQGGDTYSRYEVSNYSRVWDLKNDVEVSQVITGKPQYLYVNLYRGYKDRTLRRVHNIVGWSFLGEPPTLKHSVDHIDQDKFNNHLDNLRWLDRKGQMNNRSNTLVCSCGTPITELLIKDSDVDENYDAGFFRMWFNQGVKDYKILKEYWVASKTYGSSWCRNIEVNDNNHRLYKLVEDFNLNFNDTVDKLDKGLIFTDVVRGYSFPLPETKDYKHSVEFEGMWFPNKKSLCEHYKSSIRVVRSRQREGMSLKEALTHDPSDKYKIFVDGYFLTREEHCKRLGVSYKRIMGKAVKHNISFEEALHLPLERTIKHCINGIIKRNHTWAIEFGIKPRNLNDYQSKHKNFRKSLEHFGIDTTEMEIYPCDGDIVCVSKPL